MGINSINHNNHMSFTRQAYTKNMTNVKKQTPVVNDEAVSIRISNEALEKLNSSNHAVCNLDETVIKSALSSREEIKVGKASPLAQTQRQEIEVTGIYGEETLAYFVDTQLSGKLEKSNQIANQMETLIRGAVYNKDATVEQRAIDRESALKLAQHIADNYFQNPEEAYSS